MHESIYPDCPTITRSIQVGGMSKTELLHALKAHAVQFNLSAETLFASDLFTTSETTTQLTTIELTVGDLGFPEGAMFAEFVAHAETLDLRVCPLELGPHLRLQYLDQPEGHASPRHQAPHGSITIISTPLTDDDEFPKGFYLRHFEGILWLRGYHSSMDYVWKPDDHVLFCLIDE